MKSDFLINQYSTSPYGQSLQQWDLLNLDYLFDQNIFLSTRSKILTLLNTKALCMMFLLKTL